MTSMSPNVNRGLPNATRSLSNAKLMFSAMEKTRESGRSASANLEQSKAKLAARASLLEVKKPALADTVVLEIEGRAARDQLGAKLKEKIGKRP